MSLQAVARAFVCMGWAWTIETVEAIGTSDWLHASPAR